MVYAIQEKLLEEYKDYLHFKADKYSKSGLEYNDVFNQGYLFLLESYMYYKTSMDLKKQVDHKLRTYYNQEKKEEHIKYGINPENIGL